VLSKESFILVFERPLRSRLRNLTRGFLTF